MKIAIIGGNSFLGKKLYQKLLLSNKDGALHIFGSGMESKDVIHQNLFFHKYQYPSTLLDYELLSTFDAIYFCSATGVQSNVKVEEDVMYGLNTFEPIKVANELEKRNFNGKLITFGSYFEIGNNSLAKAFTEKEVIFATGTIPNHYCNSKRMLTRFISGNLHKIKWFHFILPTIYGPSENPMRLIPYLVNAIIHNEPIHVTSGTQIRQYIHIDDVVNVITMPLLNDYQSDIYNVSPDSQITIKDLIDTIFDTLKYKATNVSIINKVDENMKFLALDSSKTHEVFDWLPKIELVEGIKTYL